MLSAAGTEQSPMSAIPAPIVFSMGLESPIGIVRRDVWPGVDVDLTSLGRGFGAVAVSPSMRQA
jgi:hypothetical protein